MTSGTPPARKTCTVVNERGPLGSASTRRGTRRLMAVQSAAVGRRRPAACATAGRCRIRLVEPPKAACTTMALRTEASVRMSRIFRPRASSASAARAERRAISSQMGCPEGASAECGSDMPSASPTTCEVAAVPRNWQPPPGVAQARQRFSAAASSVIWPCANRAPTLCTRAASSPSSAASVTPPGTRTQGKSCMAARAIIIAGSPLSQVATPITPRRVGSERIRRAKDGGRIVAIRQAVEHAGGALGAAVAGVRAIGREGDGAQRLEFACRGFHQQADFPVAGV